MFTPRWRRSSFSTANGSCVEVAHLPANWRTSTFTQANGACVEIAHGQLAVGIRDSKDPSGPVLLFPPSAFTHLLHTTH